MLKFHLEFDLTIYHVIHFRVNNALEVIRYMIEKEQKLPEKMILDGEQFYIDEVSILFCFLFVTIDSVFTLIKNISKLVQ